MAIDPFFQPPSTRDEWRARARAIQSQLEGLTIAELMRGADKHGDPSRRDGRGYDPHQPRVPAGNSDGGQWMDKAKISVGERINDPRVLSDATPDSHWIPGSGYAGNGHHFPPRAVWQDWPLQPETKKVFAKAVSGSIPILLKNPITRETMFHHQWNDMHVVYNIAVTELMERYIKRHGITIEGMTPAQAHKIVEAIHASRDPRIRDYNTIVKLLARLYRLRTGRGSE